MRSLAPPFALAVGCWIGCTFAHAQDSGREAVRWPQFRGPNACGVSVDRNKLPVEFGPETNVLWKTPLPSGCSSPCIWDQRIFLTAYDKATKELETLCLDRTDGRILWRRSASSETIEKFHSAGSPAVATPATDGERVFVYFGSYGLLCYDFEGNELWNKPLPLANTIQGTGTSPVVVGELLLLHREFLPEPSLMAVNCRTGETIWNQVCQLASVPGPRNAYSTPALWQHDGVDEVIIQNRSRISAHDLKDGTNRWSIQLSSSACSTPVNGDGLLFVVGHLSGTEPGESDPLPTFDDLLKKSDKDGDDQISNAEFPDNLDIFRRPEATGLEGTALKVKFLIGMIDASKDGQVNREEWSTFLKNQSRELSSQSEHGLVAIKSGGIGDVTASHVLWREKRALPEVPSPLHYQGRIYLVRDGGIASCLEATTGRLLYRGRLGAEGPYFASPVVGDGKIFAASRNGVVVVLAAGDDLKVLARNDLGELIAATPALVDGKIYVRTEKHLYAFGE